MPRQQIHVISAIQMTDPIRIAEVECCALFQPKKRNVYVLAITASDAITITSATKIAQPFIHPRYGPSARVPHANVVPASGSARFKYL